VAPIPALAATRCEVNSLSFPSSCVCAKRRQPPGLLRVQRQRAKRALTEQHVRLRCSSRPDRIEREADVAIGDAPDAPRASAISAHECRSRPAYMIDRPIRGLRRRDRIAGADVIRSSGRRDQGAADAGWAAGVPGTDSLLSYLPPVSLGEGPHFAMLAGNPNAPIALAVPPPSAKTWIAALRRSGRLDDAHRVSPTQSSPDPARRPAFVVSRRFAPDETPARPCRNTSKRPGRIARKPSTSCSDLAASSGCDGVANLMTRLNRGSATSALKRR